MSSQAPPTASSRENAIDWRGLAEQIIEGDCLTRDQGLAILAAPDEQLLDILAAAYRIRHTYFGNTVQLYFLMNAKSGLCPEDCAYCSQSRVSQAPIPKYNILARQQILEGAQMAHDRGARTYCIVISARSPNEREMEAVEQLVPEIKRQFPVKVCASLGLLTLDQARRLKAAGVDRINHNLNTSERFYEQICSTHSYRQRIDTLHAVEQAGLELCCGGILGMGEQPEDVVEMAMALRALKVHSIPVNFLNPVDGTPLAGKQELNPRYCLKALAMFRFANPQCEIRIAGGRELHLRSLQAMGLYAANSLFVGDYLTTKGQAPESDYRMIEDMGFQITRGNHTSPAIP